MKTVTVQAEVSSDRELRVVLPDDVAPGRHTFHIAIEDADLEPASARGGSTLGTLLESEFFGMWADRDDIDDSARFAADLRSRVERRQA